MSGGRKAPPPRTDLESVLQVVRSLVHDQLPAYTAWPDPDTALVDLAFDSLRTVALLVAVEDALCISLPAHLITAETFHNCRTIATACSTLQAPERSQQATGEGKHA